MANSEAMQPPVTTIADRLDRTCTVIVNYQTPDLLENAVTSFKRFYPEVHTVIVDNGSKDESSNVIRKLYKEYNLCESLFLKKNLGHGPAMHAIIERAEYEFYFFLDSDTVTKRGGFLEKMLVEFDDPSVYGVGEVGLFNKRGFFDEESGISMLIAAYMLIRSYFYQKLPPFEHHGAPVAQNFYEASKKGYHMIDFPIEQFITHLHCGTVDRFGYGLGLKGKINYLLNKLGL